eukprot:gene8919-10451_t
MTLAFISSFLFVLVPLLVTASVLIILLRIRYTKRRPTDRFIVGFFHPYCAAGGGGERVLWCSVKAIQDEYPDVKCAIYTGDNISSDIFSKIKNTFGIELDPRNVEFVRLTKRKWVEAGMYPKFTLLGQSLGSMLLGWEALTLLNPHVYIDTMGYAFTYPIFRLIGGCKVACYVHYPVVSSDMISRVGSSHAAHNNDLSISRSKLLTYGKYYKIFALIYCLVGNFSQIVFVNGTWTGGHVGNIWRRTMNKNMFLLYPPVDTRTRKELPLNWLGRKNIVLSIAQFRPEKDHTLQLQTLHYLLEKYPEHRTKLGTKMILVGSTRDQDDRDRVEALRTLAVELGIEKHLEINVGVSATHLNQLLNEASVGIHTMWCEHFGIGVVELMAAGVIPVAHNSGGPKEDIIKHQETGFLATTKEEYGDYIHEVLASKSKYVEMQKKGRNSTDRFSEENYMTQFIQHIDVLLPQRYKKDK